MDAERRFEEEEGEAAYEESGNSGSGLLNGVGFYYIALTLVIKNNMLKHCIYLYFLLCSSSFTRTKLGGGHRHRHHHF